MPESKDRKPWSEPEHRKNAEQLRTYANGELARKFPNVRFEAQNVTDDDLNSSPSMAEAARLEGLRDLARDIEQDGYDADAESAITTLIRVFMYSDSTSDISRAASALAQKSRQLHGRLNDDSGTIESGMRDSLDKVLGHQPQHEDVMQYMRAIGYKFT